MVREWVIACAYRDSFNFRPTDQGCWSIAPKWSLWCGADRTTWTCRALVMWLPGLDSVDRMDFAWSVHSHMVLICQLQTWGTLAKPKFRQSILPYYTFTFFSRFGHPPVDLCRSMSSFHFRTIEKLRSGFTQARASPFVGYWCTRAGHRPGARLGENHHLLLGFSTYFKGMFHLLPSCAAEDVAVWSLFGGLKRDLQSPESVCVLFMDVLGNVGIWQDHDLPLG